MVATVTVSMSEDSEEDSGGVGVTSSSSSSSTSGLAAALRSSCRLSVLLLGSLLSTGSDASSPLCVIGRRADDAALELAGAAMVGWTWTTGAGQVERSFHRGLALGKGRGLSSSDSKQVSRQHDRQGASTAHLTLTQEVTSAANRKQTV